MGGKGLLHCTAIFAYTASPFLPSPFLPTLHCHSCLHSCIDIPAYNATLCCHPAYSTPPFLPPQRRHSCLHYTAIPAYTAPPFLPTQRRHSCLHSAAIPAYTATLFLLTLHCHSSLDCTAIPAYILKLHSKVIARNSIFTYIYFNTRLPSEYKVLWRACNLTWFSPCLTGPVDYLFASCHKGLRFISPGGTYVKPGFSC